MRFPPGLLLTERFLSQSDCLVYLSQNGEDNIGALSRDIIGLANYFDNLYVVFSLNILLALFDKGRQSLTMLDKRVFF